MPYFPAKKNNPWLYWCNIMSLWICNDNYACSKHVSAGPLEFEGPHFHQTAIFSIFFLEKVIIMGVSIKRCKLSEYWHVFLFHVL